MNEVSEQTLMILPLPFLSMMRAASWQSRNGVVRLSWMILSHLSTGNSSAGARKLRPALLTSISSVPPSISTALLNAGSTWARSLRSARSHCTLGAVSMALNSAAAFSTLSLEPISTSSAPALYSPMAMPLPMPPPPPVTIAFLPVRSNILIIFKNPPENCYRVRNAPHTGTIAPHI
ncbi:hypothetical protein SDC9_139546 [bioreactor metagenome]|uniref:Uncharacterized protein n=1 Tax=bioreactor metagenome TaxID=1076179 RepID=A0A645DSW8_9ZZZZ